MSKKVFIVTVHLNMGNGYVFPVVQSFFADKKSAKNFQKASRYQGEIKTMNPSDYVLTMHKCLGETPLVSAQGFQDRAEVETAKHCFQQLYPQENFQVMKAEETALYLKTMQGTKGVLYA